MTYPICAAQGISLRSAFKHTSASSPSTAISNPPLVCGSKKMSSIAREMFPFTHTPPATKSRLRYAPAGMKPISASSSASALYGTLPLSM